MITLDCTFRDGGYYPQWNFDIKLANKYLKVMEKVGIDAIEIGFRSPPDKITGQFARVSDDFIENELYIPDISYFGVMVDTGSMSSKIIKKLFRYSNKSPINLVRA